MIDKEKVREAVKKLERMMNSNEQHDNFLIVNNVIELYLADKLVEPANEEEIEKLLNDEFIGTDGKYHLFDKKRLAKALVGKVDKIMRQGVK